MHQIAELHGGSVKDVEFGRRMKGEGILAEMIYQLFQTSKKKYFANRSMPKFNLQAFRKGGNYSLNFG